MTYTTTGDAGVGIGILIVELIIGLAFLVFQIWVITRILSYDEATYTAAGQSRSLWMALGIIGLCCAGLIIDIIWFVAIKPKLDQVQTGGGGYGGAPPPTYG